MQDRPLAYVFWHSPRAGVDVGEYATALTAYHEQLADGGIEGFRTSWSRPVPELPWLPGGGFEDWYLVADFAGLGVLNQAAVDARRRQRHDVLAQAVSGPSGAGAVYRLLLGSPGGAAGPGGSWAGPGVGVGWTGWFGKRDGVSYSELHAELAQLAGPAAVTAVWQRQMVLGPAPEYRLEAAEPVHPDGAVLIAAQ